jgi:hypothetical protein
MPIASIILDRIAALDIEILGHARLLADGEDWVQIEPEGRVRRTLPVPVTRRGKPKLRPRGPRHSHSYAGDVGGPRKFFQAIEEGRWRRSALSNCRQLSVVAFYDCCYERTDISIKGGPERRS